MPSHPPRFVADIEGIVGLLKTACKDPGMMTLRMSSLLPLFAWILITLAPPALTQSSQIVDVPTRPNVTQRMLVIAPDKPKAAWISTP